MAASHRGCPRFHVALVLFAVATIFAAPTGVLAQAEKPKREVEPTSKELRRFEGHSGSVFCIALSPDGRRAASSGGDGKLLVWDVATGRVVRQLGAKMDRPALSVAFLPDGRSLLAGGLDQTVHLWDVETGRQVRTFFPEHKSMVKRVEVRPGRRFVSISDMIRVWEVDTGAVVSRRAVKWRDIYDVALSPDGRLALTFTADGGDENRNLRILDLETDKETRSLSGHTGNVKCIAFSPDSRLAVSGSEDNTLRLWDVARGKELRTIEGNGGFVTAVAFAPDGLRVLSGSVDQKLRLWDVKTGRELRRFEGHTDFIAAVTFSADGRFALSAADQTLRLWEVSK